ncbi:MAG TPA: chemotaxis protein CheB, partial [Terriglobales bacterium]|nr:chemotaxis protein CheB [Terriglobales bacterium]
MPRNGSPNDRLFVIGGSAGAIEALRQLLSALPRSFPSPILVVIHTPLDSPGQLSYVFQRDSKLVVRPATDGVHMKPGTVYVAPPNYHLTVRDGHIRLVTGPVENRHRPAIDPLFRSAAREYGSAAAGIVLSGYLDDGSIGLWSIKEAGGITVVQDPDDAIVPDMPRNALERVQPDHIVPIRELATLMVSIATEPMPVSSLEQETPMATNNEHAGNTSVFTCPECHGTLWEADEGGTLRFRCRVGHAFTADTMLQDQSLDVERALWAALRVLEENAELSHRMASRSRKSGRHHAHQLYANRSEESRRNAMVLRELLTRGMRQEPQP